MNSKVLKTLLVAPGVVVIETEVRSTDSHTDEAHTGSLLARESLLKEGSPVSRSHLEKVICRRSGYSKSETVEGKYEINEVEEGKFKITFTWETEEDSIETLDFSQGEENGTKYIKLGGFTLNKVD